jgi:hypothetical protein
VNVAQSAAHSGVHLLVLNSSDDRTETDTYLLDSLRDVLLREAQIN